MIDVLGIHSNMYLYIFEMCGEFDREKKMKMKPNGIFYAVFKQMTTATANGTNQHHMRTTQRHMLAMHHSHLIRELCELVRYLGELMFLCVFFSPCNYKNRMKIARVGCDCMQYEKCVHVKVRRRVISYKTIYI